MYLPLPVAFRSLSRLSSALSAKASTLRSYSLNLNQPSVAIGLLDVCLVFKQVLLINQRLVFSDVSILLALRIII